MEEIPYKSRRGPGNKWYCIVKDCFFVRLYELRLCEFTDLKRGSNPLMSNVQLRYCSCPQQDGFRLTTCIGSKKGVISLGLLQNLPKWGVGGNLFQTPITSGLPFISCPHPLRTCYTHTRWTIGCELSTLPRTNLGAIHLTPLGQFLELPLPYTLWCWFASSLLGSHNW